MFNEKRGIESSFVKMLIAIIIFILVLVITAVVLIYLRSIDKSDDEGLFESERGDVGGKVSVSGSGLSDNENDGESEGSDLTPPLIPS